MPSDAAYLRVETHELIRYCTAQFSRNATVVFAQRYRIVDRDREAKRQRTEVRLPFRIHNVNPTGHSLFNLPRSSLESPQTCPA